MLKSYLQLAFMLVLVSDVSTRASRFVRQAEQDQGKTGLDIYSLHVASNVHHRFATTLVTSRVANRDAEAREVIFYVQLPNEAFISNFTMLVGGELRVGVVEEKEEAEKKYQAAKESGQTAGQVAAKAREANSFKLSVNVAADSKVTFNLTYQELLVRRLGIYEHAVNINPGQVVQDMTIEVFIRESRKISFLKVPELRQNFEGSVLNVEEDNKLATITRPDDYSVRIVFQPTADDQEQMSRDGIVGQLAVQYDVTRGYDVGDIEVVSGYFVHYFAPTGLEPIGKDVVFVLDVSGSMSGRKIEQVRESMDTILGDLREGDRFTILLFSNGQTYWSRSLKAVTPQTIQEARNFVSRIRAGGGTRIRNALLAAIELLEVGSSEPNVPLIIFLTDGRGSNSVDATLRDVSSANNKDIPIYSLAYGAGADWDFIKRLSLQTSALARRIYEDSDAALQLRGFYTEVATPLLLNVNFAYVGESVERNSLTNTQFNIFYSGSELVVAGKIDTKDVAPQNMSVTVKGTSKRGPVDFGVPIQFCDSETSSGATRCSVPDETEGTNDEVVKFTEKLWAYLTIKELLRKMKSAATAEEKESFKQQAVELSLKYHFVTEVTSLIIVQEDDPRLSDIEENQGAGGSSATQPPSQTTTTRPPSHGFIDSDPHILVSVGGIPLCFNLYGRDGETYLLFYDSYSHIEIYGQLKSREDAPDLTFFESLVVKLPKLKLMFTVNSEVPLRPKVVGEASAVTKLPPIRYDVTRHVANLTLDQGLVVSIHLGEHSFLGQTVKFMGLYFDNGLDYTESCLPERFSGVIGQFMCDSAEVLPVMAPSINAVKNFKYFGDIGRLRLWDEAGFQRETFVEPGKEHDLRGHKQEVCWFVHNQAKDITRHDIGVFRVELNKNDLLNSL